MPFFILTSPHSLSILSQLIKAMKSNLSRFFCHCASKGLLANNTASDTPGYKAAALDYSAERSVSLAGVNTRYNPMDKIQSDV
jgi:flagellar basal body rod protein FlgB